MDQTTSQHSEYIPMVSRISVALADASCAMLQNLSVGGGALTYFFTRWRGLDPGLAGLVWILFGIWNAVNDPLFGFISDRTKSKLGRRIPYIRFGAPLYALAFVMFWLVFPGTQNSQTGMFIQLLISLFIFDSLYTAIATSIYVMPYEMAISNKARSGIFIWKIIFTVFPMAVPLILLPIIQPGPGQDAGGFQWTMIGFAVGMGLIILFSTYFYQEKQFQRGQEQFPFFKSLKECFSNRSFIIFEIISFTVIYVQTGLMQGVLYYFDEIDVPAIPLYAALAVGIIAGILLFIRQREIWGIRLSTRIMSLVFSFGCFTILFLGKSLLPTMVGFFCFGIGFAGGMYLIPLMNGDVVDMDEHRTGLRREGMYAGVNSFITKPAISLAQAVFLWFLYLFGYDQSLAKGMQSAQAETGILFGWTLIPGILLFICFIGLKWYPLAGPAWDNIKKTLAEDHIKKESEYISSLTKIN